MRAIPARLTKPAATPNATGRNDGSDRGDAGKLSSLRLSRDAGLAAPSRRGRQGPGEAADSDPVFRPSVSCVDLARTRLTGRSRLAPRIGARTSPTGDPQPSGARSANRPPVSTIRLAWSVGRRSRACRGVLQRERRARLALTSVRNRYWPQCVEPRRRGHRCVIQFGLTRQVGGGPRSPATGVRGTCGNRLPGLSPIVSHGDGCAQGCWGYDGRPLASHPAPPEWDGGDS